MSVGYRLLYKLGITPWERQEVPASLVELVEGPSALPAGTALDVGCGTGRDAIYLARHGWQVTGVDVVKRPLATAGRRAHDAGVKVQWVHADIGSDGDVGLEAGYTLLLDLGCFHGLPAARRVRAAETMTEVAAPGATMLLFAFASARRGPAPGGVSVDELRDHFPRWELIAAEAATDAVLPGPLRNASPTWYRFTRTSPGTAPR